jgi:hypothetical protein
VLIVMQRELVPIEVNPAGNGPAKSAAIREKKRPDDSSLRLCRSPFHGFMFVPTLSVRNGVNRNGTNDQGLCDDVARG